MPAGESPTATSPHRPALESLGLAEPGLGRLERYLDLLAAWSPRVNLTAAHDPGERVRVLVAEVLPALQLPRSGRLVDVGSGNGSPGLVFALLREDLEVTLLEPRVRRWAFLREAVRSAGGGRASVVRARHDAFAGSPAETVTLRALRLPLREIEPLLAADGRVLVLGARPELDPGFVEIGGAGGANGIHLFARGGGVSRGT